MFKSTQSNTNTMLESSFCGGKNPLSSREPFQRKLKFPDIYFPQGWHALSPLDAARREKHMQEKIPEAKHIIAFPSQLQSVHQPLSFNLSPSETSLAPPSSPLVQKLPQTSAYFTTCQLFLETSHSLHSPTTVPHHLLLLKIITHVINTFSTETIRGELLLQPAEALESMARLTQHCTECFFPVGGS